MGTIMINGFQSALQSNLPKTIAKFVPPSLQNPQVLLDPSVLAALQHKFATFGTQGLVLFHQFFEAVKVSLASGIDNVFFLGFIVMLLGLFSVLFLREIPLRKSNTGQAAAAIQAAVPPASGPNRSRALLGLTLALIARKAQQPEADPDILATLSSTTDGRYPHYWSEEQRGTAVARDIIEPMSIALLASSVSNGGEHTNGAATGTFGETAPEENELPSTGGLIG